MRILILAEHASAAFGGEAALPLHYFRVLRRRGYDVWLLVHERTRNELTQQFGGDRRIIFVPDTTAVIALWRIGSFLPQRLADFTTGYLMRILTQRRQVRMARQLIAAERLDIVHQPTPVSPREPSLLFGLAAPVVIGPMNGGMDFPPGFRARSSRFESLAIAAGRAMTDAMNWLFPGKRKAAALLVANERTRLALPSRVRGRITTLVENGVDHAVWKLNAASPSSEDSAHVRFVFVGRLVDWKAVDLLLEAFKRASLRCPMSLLIIGDGSERQKLETQAVKLGVLSSHEAPGMVTFTGWLSQVECAKRLGERDALVLPSLYECGGAVVLEAMALERPVIATAWGGPKDYLDPSCGILVHPSTPDTFVAEIAEAMVKLGSSPALRRQMGKAGAEKTRTTFDWEIKVDAMLAIYRQALADHDAHRMAKHSMPAHVSQAGPSGTDARSQLNELRAQPERGTDARRCGGAGACSPRSHLTIPSPALAIAQSRPAPYIEARHPS